ncbi:RNA-splicing ligase RtcB [Pectobacterium odoriferum]|uniref:tRNA-splicing ligase RtcB n=1 Tax=Pectobacterium odoriferum TaxID=78398 RepID=A0ABD6VQJ7_9GAMM|nr:RtcB family protein [Pectobacterium odoriferum]POD96437.1 RNA-splicing ligase RtcB [Pectobacterium odoriferum]POE13735.1 RNA-splicing ligase RtcB [Pectobacterium odoriferum]POE27049.1 RNA-splicing ligase RtcB [Pectobacterium odoriferum]POE31929.1 RNA-splicing ligase RtcB [Pectobacterium odoriferum]POE40293.1 RNA-splicing ligase RtcB [Pectobacterium odoriferum]
MSTFTRLQKRLSRLGIDTDYQHSIYHLRRQNAEAQVLLPDTLPLEEKAVQQLLDFASVHLPGSDARVCAARATPDFHPGTLAPVGSIVATTENFVIPAAIGTDINCGMRLLTTGVHHTDADEHKSALIQALKNTLLLDRRDVPVTPDSFSALFDEGLSAWLAALPQQGLWQDVDFRRLSAELASIAGTDAVRADSRHAPEPFFASREILRPSSLGTVGSGNHFVELQIVDAVLDRHAAYQAGVKEGEVVIMIHTGSRDVGFYVGQRGIDKARTCWPAGEKYPASGLFGLVDEQATDYMEAMGVAARYAWINRIVLTELIRSSWKQVFTRDASKLVVDLSHNIILPEQGMNLHRKGATPAKAGEFALIPGSMGDYSYLVTGKGNPDWLWSCSHGAGRAERRQNMRNKVDTAKQADTLPWQCITLKDERLREEAPAAYKPVTPVIDIQEQSGLIQPVARLRPWLTFKA